LEFKTAETSTSSFLRKKENARRYINASRILAQIAQENWGGRMNRYVQRLIRSGDITTSGNFDFFTTSNSHV
jgi:hypothetical protein